VATLFEPPCRLRYYTRSILGCLATLQKMLTYMVEMSFFATGSRGYLQTSSVNMLPT